MRFHSDQDFVKMTFADIDEKEACSICLQKYDILKIGYKDKKVEVAESEIFKLLKNFIDTHYY